VRREGREKFARHIGAHSLVEVERLTSMFTSCLHGIQNLRLAFFISNITSPLW